MVAINREIRIGLTASDTATAKIMGVSRALESLRNKAGAVVQATTALSGPMRRIDTVTDAVAHSMLRYGASSDAVVNKLIGIQQPIRKVTGNFGFMTKSFTKGRVMLENLRKSFMTFHGELLSAGFLFAMIGGALVGLTKQALDFFMQITKGSGELGKKFIEVQAWFKLLLYQLASSEAMKDFLGMISDMLRKFEALDPKLKEAIFRMIIFGGAIALVISPLAFLGLGIYGLGQGVVKLIGFFTAAEFTIGGFAVAIGKLVAVLAIAWFFIEGVSMIFRAFGEETDQTAEKQFTLADAINTITLAFLYLEKAFKIVISGIITGGTLIAIAISLGIRAVQKLVDFWLVSFDLAGKVFDNFVALVLSTTIDMVKSLRPMFKTFADFINILLSGLDKLSRLTGGEGIGFRVEFPDTLFDAVSGQKRLASATAKTTLALLKFNQSWENLGDYSIEFETANEILQKVLKSTRSDVAAVDKKIFDLMNTTKKVSTATKEMGEGLTADLSLEAFFGKEGKVSLDYEMADKKMWESISNINPYLDESVSIQSEMLDVDKQNLELFKEMLDKYPTGGGDLNVDLNVVGGFLEDPAKRAQFEIDFDEWFTEKLREFGVAGGE